jgi:hypothetical protein
MRFVAKFENVCDRLRGFFSSSGAILTISLVLIVWRLVHESPADPDLFARVGMGRLVASLGAVPLDDPFAFTEKLPMWIDHEWLSGVVFYQLVSHGGDAALILFKLFIAAWTCLLVVRASLLYAPRTAGHALWVAVCILEASFLWGSTLRCQVFTYFFIALTYYGFAQYRVNSIGRYLALIPIASVALVNMHGGYALEMMTLCLLTAGSFIQGKRWKLLAQVSMVSILAPAFTPYGFEAFVRYLGHALTMERPTITEWLPLYRDTAALVRIVLIALPLLAGVGITLRRKERDLTALLLLSFSFYCGFTHIRFLGFAMLTAIVFGAQYFDTVVKRARETLGSRMVMIERSFALVGAVMMGLMIVHTAVATSRLETWRLSVRNYPVNALEWLRNSGGSGRLLVDFNHGSFALWRLYPRFLISMDGRYEEVYTDQSVQEAAAALLSHTPEGLAALQKIAPTHILFQDYPLSRKARASLPPEWREVYRDEQYSIYTTNVSPPSADIPTAATSDLWRPLF